MPLTLTALDAAYEAPDAGTITRVLHSLAGGRVSLATLGRSDREYLQARGSVRDGFTLEFQEGSIDQRYRSGEGAVAIDRAVAAFLSYARGRRALAPGDRLGGGAGRGAADGLDGNVVRVRPARGDRELRRLALAGLVITAAE